MFDKYDAYKDSGVEWLGDIPKQWELKKIKFVLNEINIRSETGNETLLSLSKYKGVIPKDSLEERSGGASTLIGYKKVFKNNLVINKMQAVNGLLAVSELDGITSPDYSIYCARNNLINIHYISFLLNQPEYLAEMKKRVTGVMEGFIRLYTDDLYDIKALVPSITEQNLIVSFLQNKLAEIDQAIAIKEQQIALLNERKQIVIQKAVTQGLNPNVAMKDSGVEWIGQIPEHWETLPLTKYSTRVDYRGKTPEKVEEGRLLVTTRNIKNGVFDYQISQEYIKESQYKDVMSRGLPQIGDILFTMEAPLGHSAIVDREDIAIAQRIIKFRLASKKLNSYFVNYYFQTDIFQKYLYSLGTGSTALGIKASKLGMLKLIVPNLEEQDKIVEFLKVEEQKFNSAFGLIQQQIEKLKEYKTTLINDAVTGKIKVV